MRVLVLHSRYASGTVSGENRVVEDETRLLREGGHEIVAWTPSVGDVDEAALLRRGVDAIWSTRAINVLRGLMTRHRPDVVHCHNLFPLLSPAVLRAASDSAAVVVTLHNYRLTPCLPGTLLLRGRSCEDCLGRVPWRGVTRRCFRGSVAASGAMAASYTLHRLLGTFERVHLFLAVSDFLRNKHVGAGFPSKRIVVQPNFAWPGPRRRDAGRYFLYLGRLAPEKGLEPVLAAWRRVKAPLVVVGGGPDESRLRSIAPDTVTFLRTLPGHAVPDLLRQARALLVPSLWYEGAPRSILEAYAAAVPVVATRMGALPEVVKQDRSGLLVAPRGEDGWIEAVERLRDDRESVRLGEGGRELWEELYRPEHALQRLERSYERAVGLARGGPAMRP
jgi:glycosyltransferase involved in cell wall biosynthesis